VMNGCYLVMLSSISKWASDSPFSIHFSIQHSAFGFAKDQR
jgi:hypothetical protein